MTWYLDNKERERKKQKAYKSTPEFKALRKEYDRKNHEHHLFYKQYYPKLALNLNNGIPLCTAHHNEVHGFHLRNGGKD